MGYDVAIVLYICIFKCLSIYAVPVLNNQNFKTSNFSLSNCFQCKWGTVFYYFSHVGKKCVHLTFVLFQFLYLTEAYSLEI